ncbi:MAG TPA: DUF1659 domain-containing protein [Desulfitobacterium dehalogenans]|uniref:DUF1659 domain-containing protein n=1 Tax=Desulfitobacterium dehalogenans TaxID=36854 RepID=A0A7C7D8V3_9FIRM|nr:DUF1659 domain-containing protein [Desulfitobacterium dehalogenans]
MPVLALPLTSTLTVKCETGTTPSGSPLIRKKSITGLKSTATDGDLHEIATALFSLVADQVVDITVSRNSQLLEEE